MANEKTSKDDKKEYILKPGHQHNGFDDNGGRHTFVGGEKGNDRVLLNEGQFKAFGDKFESMEQLKERQKAEDAMRASQAENAKLRQALMDKGINPDEVLGTDEVSIKKPDPSPSVGAQEPTPATTTPAPVGSTTDPVNAPPAKPAEATTKK